MKGKGDLLVLMHFVQAKWCADSTDQDTRDGNKYMISSLSLSGQEQNGSRTVEVQKLKRKLHLCH